MTLRARTDARRGKVVVPPAPVLRGELRSVALQGDFGKPRPVLVLQHDAFNETHASVTVALLSSHIVSAPLFRITLDPSAGNGLEHVSQIQIDKIVTVRSDKLGPMIGRVDSDTMLRVNRGVALWLGLA